MDKETHLKSTYGFNKFRDYQKEIIDDILDNQNVFAILPTGGGKSLLYQYPATYTNKITIVVSPLISLMNDQCIYLNSKNISSVCLNSETNISVSEYKNYKIIYATPEFITSRISKIEKIKPIYIEKIKNISNNFKITVNLNSDQKSKLLRTSISTKYRI